MAGSVNKVTLLGRLAQEPEMRYTPGGTAVCNLRVVTNFWQKDAASGESKETAEFHDVTVWGKQAESVAQYLSKGRQVYIDGRLQTRSWVDEKTEQRRYKTEVVANDVIFIGSADRETANA